VPFAILTIILNAVAPVPYTVAATDSPDPFTLAIPAILNSPHISCLTYYIYSFFGIP
jgi:hypothetical protein